MESHPEIAGPVVIVATSSPHRLILATAQHWGLTYARRGRLRHKPTGDDANSVARPLVEIVMHPHQSDDGAMNVGTDPRQLPQFGQSLGYWPWKAVLQ